MKKNFTKIIVVLLGGCFINFTVSAQTDYQKIIFNAEAIEMNGVNITSTTTNVNAWMILMDSTGKFSDINYTHSVPGQSNTANANSDNAYSTHLDRLRQMSISYTNSSSSNYNSTALYNKIVLGVEYWNANINTAGNWWFNQIGYPQIIARMLLLMRYGNIYNTPTTTDIPSTDLQNAINYLTSRDNPSTQTGANRIDEAFHWLYRGALTADSNIVNTAVTQAGSTLNLVSKGTEGINYDYCFLQHGPELMIASYGPVLLNDAYKIANCIKGTNYSFTPTQSNNAFTLLHNTFNGAIRGQYVDFNLEGRGISRTGVLKQGPSMVNQALNIDTSSNHISLLKNDSLRLSGAQPAGYNISAPYHIHFWTGDYTLHRRSGYSFGVRGVSTRTARSESINGENLLGTFLTDGVTNVQIKGDEYYNIFPLWDWNLVPGITQRQFATTPTNPNGCCSSTYYGNQAFVGGVSDSTYGCSVYSMNYYNVTAKKSWFMFDSEVVCLGAGITSTASESIATSVNQCLLQDSAVYINNGAISMLAANSSSNGNLSWVLHNNIGYFFPAGGNVNVSNQSRQGNWYTINTSQPNATVTGNVFKLWLSHGVTPNNASYAYIIAPGITNTNAMNNYNASNVKILSNTASLQAVKHDGLKMLQAIFYAAGSIVDSATQLKITVDNPCALLIKNVGTNKIVISIADPSQNLQTLNINVNFTYIGPSYFTSISLPTGNYTGSTVNIVVDSANAPAPTLNAVADSYVRNGSYANTNYGTSTGLVVKNDGSSGYTRQTYLKFDMHGTPINNIVSAKLQMFGSGNTGAGATKEYLYLVPNNTWSETGITWNNMPTTSVLLDSVAGSSSSTNYLWNIAGAIKQIGSDSLLSFKIVSSTPGSTSDVTFVSRESTNQSQRPLLILNSSTNTTGSTVINKLNSSSTSLNDVQLYPNPVQSQLTLSGINNYNALVIEDISGNVIYKSQLSGTEQTSINVAKYPSGLYFLILTGNNNIKKKLKFIRQ